MTTLERVMPHNLEAERSVLGAILIDNEAFSVVAQVIDSGAFFRDAHGRIYRHLAALAKGDQPLDLVMLKESLSRTNELDEVGGPAYIASLIDGVPFTTNAVYYARIVREHWTKRTLISDLSRRIDDAYEWDGPVTELLDRVMGSATALAIPSFGPSRDLFVTALATCREQAGVPMLLEPYVPAGVIASVVAKIKAGKTSLLLEMVRCLRRRQRFCGFVAPSASCRVLYGTEQPQTSFVKQLQDAGLQADDGVIVTYLASWMGRPWPEVGRALIERAIKESAQVIVIDTDSRWFGFKDDEENRAGAAACVQVLQPFTAQGGTVLLCRHGRKSGGSASDAGRGSSAIDGAVDLILHLQKPSGQPPEVRELEYVGRFEMPERLLIRRCANYQHSQPIEIGGDEVVEPRYVLEAASVQSESPKVRIRSCTRQWRSNSFTDCHSDRSVGGHRHQGIQRYGRGDHPGRKGWNPQERNPLRTQRTNFIIPIFKGWRC